MQDDQRKAAQSRQLTASLQAYMALYGYDIVETALIENADLFLTKAGDQIIEKLFTFERHGQQLALRPEFTAAAAYRYLSSKTQEIARWQFSGTIFEDHTSRQDVEHFSIGAELIGASGAMVDAEIIAMAARGLMAQGINDFQLVIGHAGMTRHLLDRFQLDARTRRFILNHRGNLKNHENGKTQILAQLKDYIPGERDHPVVFTTDETTHTHTQQMLGILLDTTRRSETMGGRSQQEITGRLLQKHQQTTEYDRVEIALDFLSTWVAIQGVPESTFLQVQAFVDGDDPESQKMLTEWREVISLLHTYEVPPENILIQPDLARMWDYYTGIVFELRAAGKQIGGGGRYDELARLIGGQTDIPAVGFAYYVDTLLERLPTDQQATQKPIFIYSPPENQPFAIRWAAQLRRSGLAITLTTSNSIPADSLMLSIDIDGKLRFKERTYTPAQYENLITDLRETSNHDG